MSKDATQELAKEAQHAIGRRLEEMYHTAVAIHDMAARIIGDGAAGNASEVWAIQELARGQARELERFAEKLQGCADGCGMGFFADHFKEVA